MKIKKMKTKIAWVLLLVLLAGLLLAGCKIQTPDQAAAAAAAAVPQAAATVDQTVSPPTGKASVTPGVASPTPGEVGMPAPVGEGASPSPSSSSSGEYLDAAYADAHSGQGVNSSDFKKFESGATTTYDPNAPKDKYQTDPVPAGKPQPVEWQDTQIDKGVVEYATFSINCSTILNSMDKFKKDKLSVLPEDGVILAATQVAFYKGESVFDVLLRETQKDRIQMEYKMVPIYNSNYIQGIHNIYEFDCGSLSGWMYKVNGWFPNYGSSRYQLQNGDTVEWVYTCDLGRDIGGEWLSGTN